MHKDKIDTDKQNKKKESIKLRKKFQTRKHCVVLKFDCSSQSFHLNYFYSNFN